MLNFDLESPKFFFVFFFKSTSEKYTTEIATCNFYCKTKKSIFVQKTRKTHLNFNVFDHVKPSRQNGPAGFARSNPQLTLSYYSPSISSPSSAIPDVPEGWSCRLASFLFYNSLTEVPVTSPAKPKKHN